MIMRSPALACRDERSVTQSLCVYCSLCVSARPELPKALSPWDVPLKGSSHSSAMRNVKFLDSEGCRCSWLHIAHVSHLSCVYFRMCMWVCTGILSGTGDELLISLCFSVAMSRLVHNLIKQFLLGRFPCKVYMSVPTYIYTWRKA